MKLRTGLLLALSFLCLSATGPALGDTSFTVSVPIRVETPAPTPSPADDSPPALTPSPTPASVRRTASPATSPAARQERVVAVTSAPAVYPDPPVAYGLRMDGPLCYDVGAEGLAQPRRPAEIALELVNLSDQPLLIELMDATEEDVRAQYRALRVEPPADWGPPFVLEPLAACSVIREIVPLPDGEGVRKEDAAAGLPALALSVHWDPLPLTEVEIYLNTLKTGGDAWCENTR